MSLSNVHGVVWSSRASVQERTSPSQGIQKTEWKENDEEPSPALGCRCANRPDSPLATNCQTVNQCRCAISVGTESVWARRTMNELTVPRPTYMHNEQLRTTRHRQKTTAACGRTDRRRTAAAVDKRQTAPTSKRTPTHADDEGPPQPFDEGQTNEQTNNKRTNERQCTEFVCT